jgi:hypothetical protein
MTSVLSADSRPSMTFVSVSFNELKSIAAQEGSFAGGSLRDLEGFEGYIFAKILRRTEVDDDGGPATEHAVHAFATCSYEFVNDAHTAENVLLKLTRQETTPFHLHAAVESDCQPIDPALSMSFTM